jgi:hypothetical protein
MTNAIGNTISFLISLSDGAHMFSPNTNAADSTNAIVPATVKEVFKSSILPLPDPDVNLINPISKPSDENNVSNVIIEIADEARPISAVEYIRAAIVQKKKPANAGTIEVSIRQIELRNKETPSKTRNWATNPVAG